MSKPNPQDFSQFASNFDFLKSWATPTLSVEELDKRISELKTVLFWLDQNAQALKATVQALEVQKMTLATLKNMNFNVDDLAKSAGSADPLQWWNNLTEQFQNVAAGVVPTQAAAAPKTTKKTATKKRKSPPPAAQG